MDLASFTRFQDFIKYADAAKIDKMWALILSAFCYSDPKSKTLKDPFTQNSLNSYWFRMKRFQEKYRTLKSISPTQIKNFDKKQSNKTDKRISLTD